MSPSDLAELKLKCVGPTKIGMRSGFVPPEKNADASKECLETAARLVLTSVGEDLTREGLERTPVRFAKAMREVCSGYSMTLKDAIGEGAFKAEGKGLVSVKNVEFYSMCEHHMLPFMGTVSVAYYPAEKILGLSKIPRIVNMFARRFQVQERLTRQIAEAVGEAIAPRAVLVKMTGSHMCMMMRGVEKQQSETTTEYSMGMDSLTEHEKSRLYDSL